MSTLTVKAIAAPVGFDLVMPAGHIVQIVHNDSDTTPTTTSTSYVATGVNVSITPKHADSKFLISAMAWVGTRHEDIAAGFNFSDSLNGSTTAIAPNATTGDGSNRFQAYGGKSTFAGSGATGVNVDEYTVWAVPMTYLYTPSYQNTTARTFEILWKNNYYGSAGLIILNMNKNEDTARDVRYRSSITVMEVAG